MTIMMIQREEICTKDSDMLVYICNGGKMKNAKLQN